MSPSLSTQSTLNSWSCSPAQTRALQSRRTCLRVSVSAVAEKSSSSGVRVKICGLTSASDASLAAEQGADLLGFLLWPKGKRAVSLETAKQIVVVAKEHEIASAALFVDEDAASIEAMCMEVGATYAQLHGDKAREALPDLPSTRQIIYAMHATPDGQLQTATPKELQRSLGIPEPRGVDWVVIDSMKGGSGQAFDWSALEVPGDLSTNGWLLAGGLNPANVAEACRLAAPTGVDVSSGVADASGLAKDPEAVSAFIRAAKSAENVKQS